MNLSRHTFAATAIAIVVSLYVPISAHATAMNADQIMANADTRNRPRFEVVKMKMELLGGGRPVQRELSWRFVNDGAKRTSVLKFTAPANVQAVGTMVVEEIGRTNAIWHYLPATRNVRRISADHRQNRFMGTEFVFEDFEGLKLDKYQFKALRSEPCSGDRHCHVVEAVPHDSQEEASSTYGKKIYWIDQDGFFIVKTDLYDRQGSLAKTYENSEFRLIGEYWRPKKQVMRHLGSGRSTVLTELERDLDKPFDRYYISQQYLRSE